MAQFLKVQTIARPIYAFFYLESQRWFDLKYSVKSLQNIVAKKNEVEDLQTDHQKSRLPSECRQLDDHKCNFHFICENSPGLTSYIKLRVHNINGQTTVPPLRSSQYSRQVANAMSIDKEGQTKEIEKFAKTDGVKNKHSTHVRSRITDS